MEPWKNFLQAQKNELLKPWIAKEKKDWSKSAVNEFKITDKYKQIETNSNSWTLSETQVEKQQLQETIIQAYKKNDPEYLDNQKKKSDLLDNLAELKSKNDELKKDNKRNKERYIADFKSSEPYHKLIKSVDLAKMLQTELDDRNNRINKLESLEQKAEDKKNTVLEFKAGREFCKLENDLKFARRDQNPALMGNAQEIQINNDLEKSFGNSFDGQVEIIRLSKDYKNTINPSDKKRADFAVHFWKKLDNGKKEAIGSIIMEVKSESYKGKQKNEQFIDKLVKDTEKASKSNKNVTYSLLVTTLEPLNTFVIKTSDKPNVYIVRPTVLICFINFIQRCCKEFDKIKSKLDEEGFNFHDKQTILEDFENLKTKTFEKNLQLFEKVLDESLKNIDKIISLAEDIKDKHSMKLKKYIATMTKKLASFSIKKIVKKIEDKLLNTTLCALDHKPLPNYDSKKITDKHPLYNNTSQNNVKKIIAKA